ncbi:hypothetical protein EV179_003277 [Coemansia sp. RSA 487]|nr:hypothetical protein EV179_003277 [Coemansia sp. RSA 487]
MGSFLAAQQKTQTYYASVSASRIRAINPESNLPFVVCHGLLECTSDECIQYVKEKLREKSGNESGAEGNPGVNVEGRYWNRDTAAALNFRIITDSLRTVRRVPERFNRKVKLTPEQQRQHQPLKLQVLHKLQTAGEGARYRELQSLKNTIVNSNGSGAKTMSCKQQQQIQPPPNKIRHLARRPAVAAASAAQPNRRSKRKASLGATVVQPDDSTRCRVVATASSDSEAQLSCCYPKRKAATASTSAATAQEQEQTAKQDTDVTNIYRDIQAMWVDWAAAGNQVLESASADGLTDAWSQLASIYGATSMPALYNDAMARNAATALAQAQKHGPATIWDPDAGDHAQYSFAVRDISMASGGNDESHPATATTFYFIM